jgi:hypothetical protein
MDWSAVGNERFTSARLCDQLRAPWQERISFLVVLEPRKDLLDNYGVKKSKIVLVFLKLFDD